MNDIVIRRMTEFEGYTVVGYQCDGHVDKALFLAKLFEEHAGDNYLNDVQLDDVEHCYGRYIPAGQGLGWQNVEYKSSRGAKPITQVDIDAVKWRVIRAKNPLMSA